MNLRGAFAFLLICWLGALTADAQSLSGTKVPEPTTAAAFDPEDGFLSPQRYTNAYFGFVVDFPPNARLQPVPMPASVDRRIQLLEMVGAASPHSAVSICAYEYKNKNYTDAKGILRRELDQELFVGVQELHGLSKITIDGRQFYYFETRKGVDQHMELATETNGYVLLVSLTGNDPAVVKDLSSAFYHLSFFPSQEARQHAGADASPYDGPALSSQQLHAIKAAAPAEHMDPGNIEGNIYRNAQIGMKYEFPKGWSVQPQGAIEPAVERYREKVSGEPLMGPRERDAVKACRRTLLSAWRTKPGDAGDVPYDEFGEITLSAMPLSCFPNIRFPEDPQDASAVRRFIVGLSLTQPLQRDMNDARTYEAGGKPFVLTHGTIAYKEEGDALSRRVSVAMAMTEHRGYLLIWLFAAPHDSELRELMSAKVRFDLDTKSDDPTSAKVEGGSTQDSHSAASPSPDANVPSTAATATTPAPAATPSDAPASQAQVRPSLLRDGENMSGQQMAGKPIPNKQPN